VWRNKSLVVRYVHTYIKSYLLDQMDGPHDKEKATDLSVMYQLHLLLLTILVSTILWREHSGCSLSVDPESRLRSESGRGGTIENRQVIVF